MSATRRRALAGWPPRTGDVRRDAGQVEAVSLRWTLGKDDARAGRLCFPDPRRPVDLVRSCEIDEELGNRYKKLPLAIRRDTLAGALVELERARDFHAAQERAFRRDVAHGDPAFRSQASHDVHWHRRRACGYSSMIDAVRYFLRGGTTPPPLRDC